MGFAFVRMVFTFAVLMCMSGFGMRVLVIIGRSSIVVFMIRIVVRVPMFMFGFFMSVLMFVFVHTYPPLSTIILLKQQQYIMRLSQLKELFVFA